MAKKSSPNRPNDHLPQILLGDTMGLMEQKRRKKKLTRFVILFCLCLIPIFVWFQSLLFDHDITIPVNSNTLIFVLINVNVLLVLLVLFLVLRNLAELFIESRKNLLNTKLKTKLVISFLSLSLIPTILLFFVALQFVSTSMDYWFNASVEKSLQESLKLAQAFLQDTEDRATRLGINISSRLEEAPFSNDPDSGAAELQHILDYQTGYGPDSLILTAEDGSFVISSASERLEGIKLPNIPVNTIQRLEESQTGQTLIQETLQGDLIRHITLSFLGEDHRRSILITTLLVDNEQLAGMEVISQGIEGYRQLKYMKEPFKFWLLVVLLIVTMLIIFGAVWFGFYISKGITEPVAKLAEATKRIAEGDLEFVIEGKTDDEIGLLIDAFNKMTVNLSNSNKKLAETLTALHSSSQESEQRRRYTEIILQNVSAGVISLDEEGRITTINRFAENLLNIDKNYYINKRFQDTLQDQHAAIIRGFLEKLQISKKSTIEEHLRINVLRKTYSLLINFTRLEDDENTPIGYVLMFDDLTKIEKMQRMAAWREVARRIAHEIKNPLTPIQLSAQRLRRRYPDILEDGDKIFDQCTATIINQVDELKRLVSEFSQFARMPKIQKSQGNLEKLINETLFLYKEAHKHIHFHCHAKTALPLFSFDPEQIKRCVINLLDNAVAVVSEGGNIDIELIHDEESVFIRVCDDGPGTTPEDKGRLFEPYFSTKKSGTGLGLAIVSTIVADHGGYIRVMDNQPRGSIFTIELPLQLHKNDDITTAID
ncbi:MAG: ATP-binding protein [Desulfopila sp.]|jgi:two-component system nitrogen regulation sensor histidine kinase NtrY|nr:ATP-binding protein [Desulfopila sp.]